MDNVLGDPQTGHINSLLTVPYYQIKHIVLYIGEIDGVICKAVLNRRYRTQTWN